MFVKETPADITQFVQHDSTSTNRMNPDSKVHGAIMGPTWVLSAPHGLHVGPMNLAIREWLPPATTKNMDNKINNMGNMGKQ